MALTPEDAAALGVRHPGTRGQALQRVESEIRQAQAEALGRTGGRLADLLARLRVLDATLDGTEATGSPALAPAERTLRIEERNRVRDEAARVRHHLVIQREALGLVRHLLVDQRYPIPPRRFDGHSLQGGPP